MKRRYCWLIVVALIGMTTGCGIQCNVIENLLTSAAGGNSSSTQTIGSTPGSAPSAQIEKQHPETEGMPVVVNGTAMRGETVSVNQTLMIPAKEWIYLFGGTYYFNEKSGEIRFAWQDRTALLQLDETSAQLGNEVQTLEAPYLRDDVLMVPAKILSEYFAAGVTERSHTLYITPYAGEWEVPANYSVPVLEYHAVGDDCWGLKGLFVSPSEMDKQLQYLCSNGFTTITFEDLYRIDQIQKPVMITLDDGYEDNYKNLFPLLKQYNCKATIFTIAGGAGGWGAHHRMTAEQAREMSDSGLVSIQSHTYNHCYLAEKDRQTQEMELQQSADAILDATGKQPFALAYPYGSYNDITLELMPEQYHFGITITSGRYQTSENPLLIPRLYMARDTSIASFAALVGS